MATKEKKTYYCEDCKKVMKEDSFYSSNNLEKYPNGKLNKCKACMTRHVDNWEPDTFLWILEECDVPWVPKEWDVLLARYCNDPEKVSGTTILGRYLSKMKLNQYKGTRWKDTETIRKLEEHKKAQALKELGKTKAEIQLELEQSRDKLETPRVVAQEAVYTPYNTTNEEIVLENDLTEEDKRYLLIKWGRVYKPEEWVQLEQFYNDMKNSYDIQGAGHEDNLKLVCKVSLKLHNLLDIGDIDGAQKSQKMYDGLMKSGNFTAVQNKVNNGDCLNSISELTMMCEKEGFIPRFYIDKPNDRVDETIKDMKNYVHSLVVEEMNLGSLIENAVKEMTKEEAKEEDEDIEDDDLDYDKIDELKDADYVEFNEFEEEQKLKDEEFLKSLQEDY